jgi:hypothetical protein
VKGSSQAAEIALSLRESTSNLTRELSYLLFRVEIRNRILAKDISQKRNFLGVVAWCFLAHVMRFR